MRLDAGTASGGDAEGDTLSGFENLTGSDYADTLVGDAGANVLIGGNGDDTLAGRGGGDHLDGGDGIDTASYSTSSAGVTVTLGATGDGGEATGDTLTRIENLTGSAYADTLHGNAGANRLEGGAGDDTIDGGLGADVLIGGAGIDTLIYTFSTSGVTVNLATGATSGGEAAGDQISGFENISGSFVDDHLTGDAGANVLTGRTGADTLDGGVGIDTARYATSTTGVTVDLTTGTGSGGDAEGDTLISIENLIGSNYNDTFIGNAVANRLDGGYGDDTASYAASASAVVINLVSGIGTAGDAAGDTFSGIENLRGSAFADSLLGSHDANRLEGGDGNDMLSGRGGPDELNGGAGVDTALYLYSTAAVTVNLAANTGSGGEAQGDRFYGIENVAGSAYGDALTGAYGVNRLDGGDGDDTLAGLAGADVLTGGAGSDTADYSASAAAVVINLVSGVVHGGDAGGDTLSSIENLTGSAYADALYGSNGANRLDGGIGNDVLSGRLGADQLVGGAGTDTAIYVYSTAGVSVNLAANTGSGGEAQGDTFSGIENLTGSDYADSLTGDGGVNIIDGGAGDDLLAGGAGADTLRGGAGVDTASYRSSVGGVTVNLGARTGIGADAQGDLLIDIENVIGTSYADTLIGDAGADTLNGAGGIDTASYASSWAAVNASLESGTGSGGEAAGDTYAAIENLTGSIYGDTLIGNAGANRLAGGDGDDILAGRAGPDQLIGGAGSDTASYYTSSAAVSVSLSLSTASGGDAAGDTLSSIENLTGSANADTLTGDLGANRIDGGQGADRINGAAGMDRLTGGAGNDTFVFNQPLGPTNIDAITDFAPGFDAIQLAKSVFSALQGGAAPGSLSPNAFRYSTAASTSGGLGEIIYNATTGSLLYDADGAGTGAAQQFATLSSGLALSASAFKLV